MSANYSSEDALLLTASRCRPSAATLARVRELADSADWDRVATAANTHLVLPLVLANLTAANAPMPESFLSEWRELPAMTTRDNLMLLSQLDRLLQSFAGHGIPVLTWKGPVLTASAYGSLGARHSSDLDVLVPPERMADARAALLANGYTLEKSDHGWLVPAVWHESVFLPAESGHAAIEVHPLIGIWCQVAQPSTSDLMARAITVDVAGRAVRTLSNEDMLIAVVLHGAHHWWMRLRQVADIDACAHAEMDWDMVMARARQIGIERLMKVALLLARELLESPVPDRIIEAAKRDRMAAWLTAYLARRFRRPTDGVTYPGDFIAMITHDRIADRVRHIFRLFIWRDVVIRAERLTRGPSSFSPPTPP